MTQDAVPQSGGSYVRDKKGNLMRAPQMAAEPDPPAEITSPAAEPPKEPSPKTALTGKADNTAP